MPAEQQCGCKVYAYPWILRCTKRSVLATIATYNNSIDPFLTPPAVHHSTLKGNDNSPGNCCCLWTYLQEFVIFNMREHIATITETKSTYIMIKSTLQLDDIGVVPGLFSFLQALQRSCTWSRNWSGRQPGNEANTVYSVSLCIHVLKMASY